MGIAERDPLTSDDVLELTMPLCQGLWEVASSMHPQWERLGFLVCCQDGVVQDAEELLGPWGVIQEWPTDGLVALEVLISNWWVQKRRAGRSVWQTMFVAGKRSSGDFDAFYVYPHHADSAEWILTPLTAERLLGRAWARLEEP